MPAPARRSTPTIPNHPYGEGAGEQSGVMPLGPGDLTAGKSLVDWLGELLTAPNAGKAFPKIMRLSSLNPETDAAVLHGVKDFTPFETTITELKKLLGSGELVQHGPATEGKSVEQLTSLLRRKLP